MEIAYKLLPLVIAVIAYKWPRIALIGFLLFLKLWLAAGLVAFVSVMAIVKIRFMRMTPNEYDKYKKTVDVPDKEEV